MGLKNISHENSRMFLCQSVSKSYQGQCIVYVLPSCTAFHVFSFSNWSFSFTVEDCIGTLDASAGRQRLRCPRHGPINLGFDRNSADLTAIAPDVVWVGWNLPSLSMSLSMSHLSATQALGVLSLSFSLSLASGCLGFMHSAFTVNVLRGAFRVNC